MNERTKYSVRNIKIGLLYKIVNLILKFAMRTVFIYSLGQDYVGIEGVFSNILKVLSLAELGIGSAIIYDLYKPIAVGDKKTITQLFKFYKKIYMIIGIAILGIGLCICPFLKYIITGVPNVNNIQIIYILTLLSTASSYFFAQYVSIIEGHQRQYIVDLYNMIGSVLKVCIEIILLINFKSYILYLIIDILISLVISFIIAKKAIKLYPFIKNTVENLPINKVKKILFNSLNVFSIRTASTVVNATDNILISSMISTVIAGSYSTYLLIVMSVQNIVYTLKMAVTASVGNLCATSEYEAKQRVFNNLRFIYAWANCIVVCCFLVLLTPFIRIWAGSSYELSFGVTVLIVINYLLRGIQWSVEVFYNADGLYKYFKVKPWIQVAINIICSVILCQYIGIAGIIMGTTISELLTTFWYDIFITNKYSLHGSLKHYWKTTIAYIFITIAISGVLIIITNDLYIIGGIVDIVIKFLIVSVVAALGFALPFIKTDEFTYCIGYARRFLKIDK